MVDEAEQRRRINENLKYVYSGQAARDKERLADERRAARKQRKLDERRAAKLEKRIVALQDEREELSKYLDECLEASEPEHSPDDVDVALEGCVKELGDCQDELKILREKLDG